MKTFLREEQDTSIREVYLCDLKSNTVQMFTDSLRAAFGQSNVREFAKAKPRPNQNRPLPQTPGRNRGITINVLNFLGHLRAEGSYFEITVYRSSAHPSVCLHLPLKDYAFDILCPF